MSAVDARRSTRRQHFTLERMLDDHDALYQALYHSQRNKI